MRLSAVVVTWNSGATLAECLAALRRAGVRAEVDLEIVVVDNASGDDSLEHARAADLVIANGVNAGFAVASTQGFAVAGGDWILFANPDLRVADDFLEALARAAAGADDDVAVLVPELRYASAPGILNGRGIAVDELGIPAEIGAGEPADSAETSQDPFGASGGAACIRASALERVGGFEPCFFAYLEDVDLAWRLRLAGLRAVFVPDAVAYHVSSSTTGEGSPLKSYLVARNRRLLFSLHRPAGPAARGCRELVDVGHMTVQSALTRSLAPVSGRVGALRIRRYLGSRVPPGPVPAVVRLSPRVGMRRTLTRKLRTRGLMASGADST